MGRNIIDEFFVTFGLDPSEYQKGEREVRKSFKDTRENAKATFDDVETRGKSAGTVFRSLRNEVAGLILVFAGAKSITDFASNMLTGEASASRLGETIGMNTGRVIAWEKALKSVGGTAGEADASLKAIQDAMYKFKLTGQVDPGFQAFGVTPGDLDPDNSTPEDVLLKLARNKNGFNSKELAQRLAWLGVSQNTIYLMEQYKGGLRGVIDEQERMAHVSAADVKAAKDFQTALTNLETTIEGDVRPGLTGLITQFNTFAANGQNVKDAAELIAAGIGAIALALVAANPEIAIFAAALYAIEKFGHHTALPPKAQRKQVWGTGGGGGGHWWSGLFNIQSYGDATHPAAAGGAASGAPMPAATRGQAEGQGIVNSLRSAGFGAEPARGIVAGIVAEGGSLGYSRNGAFGIGQWRGARKDALFARYGSHPSLNQQIAYLIWELKGGDRGGASVRSQSTADGALIAYLRDFMRPQGTDWGHARDLYADIGRGRRALSQSVHIGHITVHTQATDGHAVARDLSHALRKRGIVAQANTGLTP